MKQRLRRDLKDMNRLLDGGDDDPALTLFIRELAKVFQKHFKLKPTVLGPSGEENTPFIAFVVAVARLQKMHLTVAQVSDMGRRVGIKEDE
jgi:hypothetical protein